MFPVELFSASQLPEHVQTDVCTGRKRKVAVEAIETCPLRELVQWKCEPDGEQVRCKPVERFFRMYVVVKLEVRLAG